MDKKKQNKNQFIWVGERERPLRLYRPCSCGCDYRDGNKGIGYLSGSNQEGVGFTIWIESEEVFGILQKVMLDGRG